MLMTGLAPVTVFPLGGRDYTFYHKYTIESVSRMNCQKYIYMYKDK